MTDGESSVTCKYISFKNPLRRKEQNRTEFYYTTPLKSVLKVLLSKRCGLNNAGDTFLSSGVMFSCLFVVKQSELPNNC